MNSLIVVHPEFESHWPFVADIFYERWQSQGETQLLRLPAADRRLLSEIVPRPQTVTRLVCLDVPASRDCLEKFSSLREAAFSSTYRGNALDEASQAYLQSRGVILYEHRGEGFWGQSVAEIALALTICALRRIPQQYHEMIASHEPWRRYRPENNQGPGTLGAQFCDDLRFTHGTVAGKRVRIVGAGNIGSRFASFMQMLGADVASWDPFAADPNFHRTGARRIWHLTDLVADAEIFAPMLPLTESTRGLVTAQHIDALPTGCLMVTVTRAHICDTAAIRRRVLADEISLAADVFDVEPLSLDDPLLGRHNVVHTPHIAGRTFDSNRQWVENLADQFRS